MTRKVANHISQQLGENATVELAEAESLINFYGRKRYPMSFEDGLAKRAKSHSPTGDTHGTTMRP